MTQMKIDALQQLDSIETHASIIDCEIDGNSDGSTIADQELPTGPKHVTLKAVNPDRYSWTPYKQKLDKLIYNGDVDNAIYKDKQH